MTETPESTQPSNWRDDEVVHRTPVPYADGGDGTTRCCGRSPFELPTRSRLTNDDALVTCDGGPR
jgi:hypothetical protein